MDAYPGSEMKLSEAILRGCEMAPKQLTKRGRDGTVRSDLFIFGGCACAIGAASLAIGSKSWLTTFNTFGHDVCNQVLNENELYTREQIAASLAEAGL